jgi:enoyl-CoA hydratase
LPLEFSVEDHIAVITVDNPPLNTFPDTFVEELRVIVDSFADLPNVRVAIITGSGTRSFTAGNDASGSKDTFAAARTNPRAVRNYVQALNDSAVPIVAAVNGYCLGHGMAIVSSCDIVVASTNASFGLPEIDVGSGNGQRFMREMFPRGHARHSFYTGERISAAEAYRLGAVFKLVEPDELMPEAFRIARTIAEKSPLAIRMFKQTVAWTDDMDLQTAYRFEGQATMALRRNPEGAAQMLEARRAFFAKRKPIFE